MIKKILCAVALASAGLAQKLSIASPAGWTEVAAGAALVIQIERPTPPTDTIQDVALVIAGGDCSADCPVTDGLGYSVLYVGNFNPQSTGNGKEYQNFTVHAPNYFNGKMGLNVAHFYLEGLYNELKTETVSTFLNITGASG